jgi:hypothetical protein
VLDCRQGLVVKVHSTYKVTPSQSVILFAVVKGPSVFIVSDDGRQQQVEEVGLNSAYSTRLPLDVKVTCIEVVYLEGRKTVILGTETGLLLEVVDQQVTRSLYAGPSGSYVTCLVRPRQKYSAAHDLLVAGLKSSQIAIFARFSAGGEGYTTEDQASGPVTGVEVLETSHVCLVLYREDPASLSLVKLPKDQTEEFPIEVTRQVLEDSEGGLMQ